MNAYKMNLENYREKLLSSINKHLDMNVKVVKHVEEQSDNAYSNL